MDKNKKIIKSSLLDMYIQKQNKKSKFNDMDEEEIAKAIKTLLQSDNSLEELN
ncbi:MAG: hypothetical protein GX366_04560 [Epulopiscium sp.]|nr:hypothetical protein [Candidatus Epulonipiscium sp.]